ncbi:MAG TPA: hypothetical protein VFR48_10465, partial [Solirubrobacteraceae bacterium]|nr:hypothetical protein [Solirubrobacteraceae bacterium]
MAALAAGLLAAGVPSAAQANFTPPYTTQCSGGEAFGIDTGLEREATNNLAFEFDEEDLSSPLSCAGQGPLVELLASSSPAA